ncbi:MAG: PHP domain-containing protein, partial [Planctomycetota bacterium]
MQYVELHCRSNFSFLEGAAHPDELVQRAADLGYRGIAITDRESIAGVVRGYGPANDLGLQYIVGSEVHPIDAPAMVLWPTDRAAYGRLCRLLSRGRMRAAKGRCELKFDDIAELAEGILAGVIPDAPEAGSDNKPEVWERPLRAFLRGPFRDVFADRRYVLAELLRGVDDAAKVAWLRELSVACDAPLVAAGDVRYHTADRQALHDCLTAIAQGTTVEQIDAQRLSNAQHHLRERNEIAMLYRDLPRAVERTLEIAGRCCFDLSDLKYEYPKEVAPEGKTPIEHLKRLAWEGARQRWPEKVPEKVIDALRHEVNLIEDLKY